MARRPRWNVSEDGFEDLLNAFPAVAAREAAWRRAGYVRTGAVVKRRHDGSQLLRTVWRQRSDGFAGSIVSSYILRAPVPA
jgi:hypothetical protein